MSIGYLALRFWLLPPFYGFYEVCTRSLIKRVKTWELASSYKHMYDNHVETRKFEESRRKLGKGY